MWWNGCSGLLWISWGACQWGQYCGRFDWRKGFHLGRGNQRVSQCWFEHVKKWHTFSQIIWYVQRWEGLCPYCRNSESPYQCARERWQEHQNGLHAKRVMVNPVHQMMCGYIPWDACWCSHLQCLSLHASWSLHIALGYPHCWPLALNTINKLQWSSRATVRVMPAMYQTSDSPNCWRHPQQDQTWDTCQYCLCIPANCRSSWNTPEEECGTGWYAVWTPFNLVDTGNTSMNTGPVQTVGHGNEWKIC